MGLFDAIGGIATVYNGYEGGVERAKEGQRRDAEASYLQGQRTRQVAAQDRGEELRQGLAAVPTDDQTQDQILRNSAKEFQKQGDFAKAMEIESKADEIGFARSTRKLQGLTSEAESLPLVDLAKRAAEIYNNDPVPSTISNVTAQPDGSVSVDIAHGGPGGSTVSRVFKDKASLMTALQAHYSPASFAAMQKFRQESAIKTQDKISEEMAKPQKLSPGQELYVGGKRVAKADAPAGMEYVGEGADGNPMYRRLAAGGVGGAGGAGAGGAGGKAPKDAAVGIVEDLLKGPAKDMPADQHTKVYDYLQMVQTQDSSLPPATAARVAVDAVMNPTKVSLQIGKNGQIASVYRSPDVAQGRAFSLAQNAGTAADMEKVVGKAGMKQAVDGMLTQQANDATRDAIKKAAGDAAYNSQLEAQIQKDSSDPAALTKNLNDWRAKVALVRAYAPATPAAAPRTSAASRLSGFGLGGYTPPADSPAGRASARREEAAAAANQKRAGEEEARAATSAEFARDAATLEPLELVRKYDKVRSSLSTSDAAKLRAAEQKI